VEQGGRVKRPSDDIRSTGELEVLIRLFHGGRDGVPAQMRELELTHRRVHRILRADG
jgi:hypothetical protein